MFLAPVMFLGDEIGDVLFHLKLMKADATVTSEIAAKEAKKLIEELGYTWPSKMSAARAVPASMPTVNALPFKKAALIAAHVHEWPTIERDIADAQANGLAVAKAGERGWVEAVAMDWARANGRLIAVAKAADSLAQAIHNMGKLPSRKHTM